MNETGIWSTLLVKLRLQWKSKVLGEKRVPLFHCLRQIPRILTRDRKRASAVRSRRVTARLCAVEPRAFGTEDCGLPRWLRSFHHNASQQATSCNVLAPSLLETSLSFSVIFDRFCTHNRVVTLTSLSVNHTAHGLCDNGGSILNKTSRNAVRFLDTP